MPHRYINGGKNQYDKNKQPISIYTTLWKETKV